MGDSPLQVPDALGVAGDQQFSAPLGRTRARQATASKLLFIMGVLHSLAYLYLHAACAVLGLLRAILYGAGALLLVGSLCSSKWPLYALKYVDKYWHITLIYTLPFLGTLTLLTVGQTSGALVYVFSMIVLSGQMQAKCFWVSAVAGTLVGLCCGWMLAASAGQHILSVIVQDLSHFLWVGLPTFCFIALFCKPVPNELKRELRLMLHFRQVLSKHVRMMFASNAACARAIRFFADQTCFKVLPGRREISLSMQQVTYISLGRSIDESVSSTAHSLQVFDKMLSAMQIDIDCSGFQALSMRDGIRYVLDRYAFAKTHRVQIVTDLAHDFIFHGSVLYLEHLIFQLIDNARFHGGEQCKINVSLRSGRLYVVDNGPGISSKVLPRIFDDFFTTRSDKLGLGLPFCRRIMRSFGGYIVCKSERGKFSFTQHTLVFPQARKSYAS